MLGSFIGNIRGKFRSWVRKRTTFMTVAEAEQKRLFWAKAYLVCSLIAMITASFKVLENESKNPGHIKATLFLKNEMPKVAKYEGFQKVDVAPGDLEQRFVNIPPSFNEKNDSSEFNKEIMS